MLQDGPLRGRIRLLSECQVNTMMTKTLAESIFVAGIVFLIFYIFHAGRAKALNERPGWAWVVAGLCVLLFASAIYLWRHLGDGASSGSPDGAWVYPVVQYVIGFLGGMILLTVGLLRVVADGRRDERQTDDILTAAIEGISEGLIYFDADDRLVLVNGKIGEMYPLARDVFVLGVSYETCLRTGVEKGQWGPEDGDDEEAWIRRRLDHHFNPKGPVEFNMSDGRIIRVEERKTSDGGIVGIRADITDLRQARQEIEAQRDELEKLNAQKDRFFAIIAHDLKSPFAGLLQFSEILATQASSMNTKDVAEYGAMVHRAAEQAYELLEDLLDWSRLQLDRMEFEPAPMDAAQAIMMCLNRFSPLASAKQITFKNDADLKHRVHADARMVDTVLRNLIDNAIKFTPDNGVITIRAGETEGFGFIEVADTGIGMTRNKLENLFHLDQKHSTRGTRGETGTGFGLLLCKELVEKLGGHLHVESAEGQGSSIRFTLPIHQS